MDRRDFLRGIAAGAAALPLGALAGDEPKARVAVAERAKIIADGKIDRTVVKEAIDAVVKKLSGKENIDEAWRTYVSPKETVALKFNGLFRRATTSVEVIWSVARGLVDAGIPQEKIIVYDWRTRDFETAQLKPFDDLPKVQFLTSDSDWDEEVDAGPVRTRLTRIITQKADALINLSRLKHHVLSGITISMKNHFGTVPNPRDFHPPKIASIADLNALPPIKTKTRLCLCDAVVAIFDKGPQFNGANFSWEAKSILGSTDSLAIDTVGADMIRKTRIAKGAGDIKPEPVYLARAAELGLGTGDLAKIEIAKA
ncbi:MAG: DUF362 domain-containing protein [Planctomycetes bacterium]|nr:DUF362 domain-containing protein [Planctomycetota bacterium]